MKEPKKTHLLKFPLKLERDHLDLGDILPSIQALMMDDKILDSELQLGKLTLISTFPSINTKVCSLQTQHMVAFCKQAGITLINISTNSYQDASEWCLAHDETINFYSDPQGIYLKKLGLYVSLLKQAARAVYLFDEANKLIYKEICDPISKEPAIEPIKAIIHR